MKLFTYPSQRQVKEISTLREAIAGLVPPDCSVTAKEVYRLALNARSPLFLLLIQAIPDLGDLLTLDLRRGDLKEVNRSIYQSLERRFINAAIVEGFDSDQTELGCVTNSMFLGNVCVLGRAPREPDGTYGFPRGPESKVTFAIGEVVGEIYQAIYALESELSGTES